MRFGDIVQEPSTNDGHVSTWMYLFPSAIDGYHEALCLDDTDPYDKSLIGGIHLLGRAATIITSDDMPEEET